jgi:hypothetical protein
METVCSPKRQCEIMLHGTKLQETSKIFKYNFSETEKKTYSPAPDGGLTLGQTDRLTVGRKITLSLKCGTLLLGVVQPRISMA